MTLTDGHGFVQLMVLLLLHALHSCFEAMLVAVCSVMLAAAMLAAQSL